MALIANTLEDWRYAYKSLEKKEMEQRATIKRQHKEILDLKHQLRESQNASTSESALPISDVVKTLPSENKPRSMSKCMMCGRNNCICHGKR